VNKLLPKTILFLVLFITAITILWLPIQADEPTAVHLASFDVVPLNNAVRINWETATEIGTAGFKIKRAATGGNEEFLDYVGDNGFVEASGNVTSGSSYTATDNQVNNGEAYTYILIELENSGTETELARETITVGIPPTNTPAVVSGGNGGSSATATPVATATVTKRATSNPSASATPATNSNTTSPTQTSPSFVTITPKSVQPTATPTRNTTTTNTNQSNNNNSDSDFVNETSNQDNNTDDSMLGVTEVLAQEDSTETVEIAAQTDVDLTQQTQDDYPAVTATAVSSSDEIYPSNTTSNSTSDEPVSTPVAIIGSNPGYTGTDSDTSSSSGTTSSSEGQIFLWLGFIVALLIFITGVIGSIILFTRKSQ
jgi:hypothetical protein